MDEVLKRDILIIGGGAAGLNAALNLESKNALLLEAPGSNSLLSPWNLMVKERNNLKEEILNTGNNMNDLELLDTFLDNIDEEIKNLRSLGVKLKTSNIGLVPDYKFPGKAVRDIFIERLKDKGMEILTGQVVNFLINDKGQVVGVDVELLNKKEARILFKALIIASGGLGGLFKYRTGNIFVDGSIISLCYEAGFLLKNLEFFMFHPFLITDRRLPKLLVSGTLLTKMDYEDENGKPFLSEEVTEALRENKHHYIFPKMVKEFYLKSLKGKIFGRLNCDENWFEEYKKKNEFGYIFSRYKKVDLEKIEVHPAFHFSIGGLAINKDAQTNMENIFAAGEVTGGLHGSNRIGGLAVLEGLIFGKIAAQNVIGSLKEMNHNNLQKIGNLGISENLKERVWESLGPVKNKEKLKSFKDFLENKQNTSQEKIIKKILEISLLRKESIGAFYRKDLPLKTFAKSSYLKQNNIVFK